DSDKQVIAKVEHLGSLVECPHIFHRKRMQVVLLLERVERFGFGRFIVQPLECAATLAEFHDARASAIWIGQFQSSRNRFCLCHSRYILLYRARGCKWQSWQICRIL